MRSVFRLHEDLPPRLRVDDEFLSSSLRSNASPTTWVAARFDVLTI